MSVQTPPLLVFADDWGRHPSSCQHLVSRVLGERQVVWVNTIGTRPPRLDAATVRRVAGKVAGWLSRAPVAAGSEAPDRTASPRVLNPRMWPSFERPAYRQLNRRMLVRSLAPVLDGLDGPPDVLTTLPITADLVGCFPARSWTYYCVDDFGTWPGYYGATLASMERELVPKVDLVVAASETLAADHAAAAKRLELLTHGVDLETWRARTADAPTPPLESLPRPWVVFWGLVDRRMDVAWVEALSRSMNAGTILMIGPHDAPDPRLASIPRVAFVPPVDHRALASIADRSAVLVMPYADLPATRAMQPLKLKEYMATGRPVVVRDLPATRPWSDACNVCADADAFVHAVGRAIRDGLSRGHADARLRLETESWDAKAADLFTWIGALGSAGLTPERAQRPGMSPQAPIRASAAACPAGRATRGEPG